MVARIDEPSVTCRSSVLCSSSSAAPGRPLLSPCLIRCLAFRARLSLSRYRGWLDWRGSSRAGGAPAPAFAGPRDRAQGPTRTSECLPQPSAGLSSQEPLLRVCSTRRGRLKTSRFLLPQRQVVRSLPRPSRRSRPTPQPFGRCRDRSVFPSPRPPPRWWHARRDRAPRGPYARQGGRSASCRFAGLSIRPDSDMDSR